MRFIMVADVVSSGGLTSGSETGLISRALLFIKSDMTSSETVRGVIS